MDKELQKKLIAEVMHQDEDLGLYDWTQEETRTFARLHLEGLKQDREKLKKEIEELKRGIEKIEEMKRELEEAKQLEQEEKEKIHEYYKRRR